MADLPLFDPYKALEEIRRNAAREEAKALPQELPQELPQTPAGAKSYTDQRLGPTSATSAGSAGVPVQLAPRVPAYKEEERRKNVFISSTYARDGGGRGGSDVRGGQGAAEVAEAAEVWLSHSDHCTTEEIELAEVLGDGLRKWRSALSALSPDRAPCPGYRGDEWPRTLARAVDFLDRFGEQAEVLGWTAPRLFGVHETAGIIRVDACGALVLPISGSVRAITGTEISFGHLTHREKPGQPQGVPWWEFGR